MAKGCKAKCENGRVAPFTLARRDKCVAQIMDETGIGRYEAEIAYRIATRGLVGVHTVTEKKENE